MNTNQIASLNNAAHLAFGQSFPEFCAEMARNNWTPCLQARGAAGADVNRALYALRSHFIKCCMAYR